MSHMILITGSRDSTTAMLDKADAVVSWAFDMGHQIIVGEAPGIDAQVRKSCERLVMSPYVFGANSHVRQPAINLEREQRGVIRGSYLARDRLMAERCDRGIAIMRAPRTRGTWYTGCYVESLGKRMRWAVWDDASKTWSYYDRSEDISSKVGKEQYHG